MNKAYTKVYTMLVRVFLFWLNKFKQVICFCFCKASALDGRRDFREIVGVNQLKALWPILMKLDIGKRRVNPDELFKYVKVSLVYLINS